MKFKIFTFLILLLISQNSFCQRTNILGLTFGFASPTGLTAKDNPKDSLSGYGTTGMNLNLNWDHVFENDFGTYLGFNNQSIGFNDEKFNTDLKDNDPLFVQYANKAKGYNIKSFNTGFSYTFKSKRVILTPKLGWGWSICRNKTFEGNYGYLGSALKLTTESNTGFGVNLNYGFDFSIKPIKDSPFSIQYKFLWQTQRPVFENTTQIYIDGKLDNTSRETYSQPLNSFSFSMGVRYTFESKKAEEAKN